MSDALMPDAVKRILDSGRITADDVLTLRRTVFADGAVGRNEAEWLFALNDRCSAAGKEWPDFFVEALTDYTVHQVEPHGYVSEENAGWLVDRISRNGIVKTDTELELLVKVLEAARTSPESLVAFALAQVKAAVLDGEGPVASGRSLEPGRIGEAEVEILRRMLYAYAGPGNIAVTRTEADLLFDINDATHGADNHPAWSDLFVKAIANHLMAAFGHVVPPRQVALARAQWLDDETSRVDRFIVNALSGGLKGIWQAYRQPGVWEERLAEQERAIAAAEPIDAEEARWLTRRIERNGRICDHERALVRFLIEESPAVDAALKPLIEKAGRAA